MMPGHSCHIYGTWRSKEGWDTLESSFGVAMQATYGRAVCIGKTGFLLY